MENLAYIVLLITAGSIEEAQRISRALLEQKKVACVNIVPQISSLFWWQGKIDSESEVLLLAKTKASKLPEILDLVREIHSYDVPEVIALPILDGNREYLEWIDKEIEN